MKNVVTITETKARLSEIISRVQYNGDEIIVTKNGKEVAVIIPAHKISNFKEKDADGLLSAAGALSDIDDEVDKITSYIYEARDREYSRKVSL